MSSKATKLALPIVTLILVSVLARTSFSQEMAKEEVIRPLTKAGSAAFMFTIQGLGSFNIGAPGLGTVIVGSDSGGITRMNLSGAGMKYFVSDDLALRIGLGLRTNSFGADSLPSGAVSATAFGIAAGVEMHGRPLYSTSPYFGAQVSFASGSETITNKVAGKDVDTKFSSSQFGIGAFAGFDWFFTRGIAAGAEVGLGFTSASSSSTVAGTTNDNPSASGIALATNADVHLVVYF